MSTPIVKITDRNLASSEYLEVDDLCFNPIFDSDYSGRFKLKASFYFLGLRDYNVLVRSAERYFNNGDQE